jgi:hypothetical protein
MKILRYEIGEKITNESGTFNAGQWKDVSPSDLTTEKRWFHSENM